MASSVKSTALEPTRSELEGLPTLDRIKRLAPVYGLVILTVALALLFSILLPDTFPTLAERPLDHLRQGDHRHPFARRR